MLSGDSENPTMASVPRINLGPVVGNQVFLLCQTDGCPRWTTGTICSETPFAVELESGWDCELHAGAELVLIHESARTVSKASTRVHLVDRGGKRTVVTFEAIEWTLAESRDYERYRVDAPSIVRSIADSGDGVRVVEQLALTKNISIGGALVKLGQGVRIGDLIDFQMTLGNGHKVRAMGLVAHSNDAGTTVGLSFVDYIGHSRRQLVDYLESQAA
jgi:hypothetical protein